MTEGGVAVQRDGWDGWDVGAPLVEEGPTHKPRLRELTSGASSILIVCCRTDGQVAQGYRTLLWSN